MSVLEFGGRLDQHLIEGADGTGCTACDDAGHDECRCEPDFEAMVADRAEWLAS